MPNAFPWYANYYSIVNIKGEVGILIALLVKLKKKIVLKIKTCKYYISA